MILKHKKKIGLIGAVLLAIALIPIFNLGGQVEGSLEDDKKAAQENIDSFKKEIDAANGQITQILGLISKVESNIESLNATIAQLEKEQVVLTDNIKVKTEEVKVAQEVFDEKKTDVYERARKVYESGEVDYTAVVLQSEDLTDMTNSNEYYRIFKEKETEKVKEVKEEREKLEVQKTELEVAKQELETNQAQCEVEKSNEQVEQQKLEGSKVEAEKAKADYASKLAAEESTLASIQAELNAAIQASGGVGEYVGSGIFQWPVPSITTISSPYGPRWGTFHRGIDIANGNAFGATIVAAETGTVAIASSGGYGGGFGNFVVINHGGGVMTLYGHMNSVGVSQGQAVTRGQAIGTVGNTGDSYGAHLHFQVTSSGDIYSGTVDPMSYL